MQEYMKSDIPYYGVRLPDVRRICRPIFATHPIESAAAFDDTVEGLFVAAMHREERYAAIELAKHPLYRSHQTPDRIPLYRRLIIAGGWWDTVDDIASNLIGPILVAHAAEVGPIVLGWAADQNLWVRRTAIIAQLGSKRRTDLTLLTLPSTRTPVTPTSSFARPSGGHCGSTRAMTRRGFKRSSMLGKINSAGSRSGRLGSTSECFPVQRANASVQAVDTEA
jgi:hypothetical protein